MEGAPCAGGMLRRSMRALLRLATRLVPLSMVGEHVDRVYRPWMISLIKGVLSMLLNPMIANKAPYLNSPSSVLSATLSEPSPTPRAVHPGSVAMLDDKGQSTAVVIVPVMVLVSIAVALLAAGCGADDSAGEMPHDGGERRSVEICLAYVAATIDCLGTSAFTERDCYETDWHIGNYECKADVIDAADCTTPAGIAALESRLLACDGF